MVVSADVLMEQMQSRKRLTFWRNITFGLIGIVILLLLNKSGDGSLASGKQYIARVVVDGLILEDTERLEQLKRLKDSPHVKAVIVSVNSPGGTLVGGEALYKTLKDIASQKPVVSVMGSTATSGGYMVAMAGKRVYAYEGTITGSIGVLVQTAEITGLASKLGVALETFKTDELKGAPSPLEKVTPKVRDYMRGELAQAKALFVRLVSEARGLPKEKVEALADGRIFMGSEAVSNGLVDDIGDETSARQWLIETYHLEPHIVVRTYPEKEQGLAISKWFSVFSGNQHYFAHPFSSGMMAIWQPTL